MKILIVGDSETTLVLFLESLGHEVFHTRYAEKVVPMWRSEQVDMILMDKIHPAALALEITSHIKREAKERWIPIIFLISADEESQFINGVTCYIDDYIVKPIHFSMLEIRLKAIGRTLELDREVHEQSAKLTAYEHRAKEAKKVFKYLMDQIVGSDWCAEPQLQYWIDPADGRVSGDLITCARTPDDILHILLADGLGHGLTAALTVLPLTQPFYSMTEKGYGLPDILEAMNSKIQQVLPPGRFVAIILIALNDARNHIEICNSGMPPVMILDENGDKTHIVHSNNLPLGVMSNSPVTFSIDRIRFDYPGVILALSDGLTEARNRHLEPFGFDRVLSSFLGKNISEWVKSVKSHLHHFLDGMSHHDDISLLLAQFGQDKMPLIQPSLPLHGGKTVFDFVKAGQSIWHYDLRLGSTELKNLNVIPFVMSFLLEIPSLKPCRREIYRILTELYSNALDYGLLEMPARSGQCDTYDHESERSQRLTLLDEGVIELSLMGTILDGRFGLIIRIKDSGPGFDWQAHIEKRVPLAGPLHGLSFVKSLCADLRFLDAGREALACYLPEVALRKI